MQLGVKYSRLKQTQRQSTAQQPRAHQIKAVLLIAAFAGAHPFMEASRKLEHPQKADHSREGNHLW